MACSAFALLALSAILPYAHASPLHVSHPTANLCSTSDAVRFAGKTANNVESFLNIRFGQDTSGPDRFAPPKPFKYPPGTLVNATQAGAACPQPKNPAPGLGLFDTVTHMSEDCLNLRIDRPVNTTAQAKLPVMVWIYGGGDSFGQIYDSIYDPTALVLGAAAKGTPVIYVAMNYRLSVFGFAASEALSARDSLNAGLLDQRLALEWVQENIAVFGGDPDNVTIFGESDGATGAALQITAYGGERRAPFKRAIMQSGSAMADKGTVSTKSIDHTTQLTQLVNCTAPTSEEELQCLRSLSMEKLNSAAIQFDIKVTGDDGMDVFIPIAPSTFIPDSPSKLVASGRFSRNIDTMGGWNEDDGSFSADDSLASEKGVALWLADAYPALSQRNIDRALALYPVSLFPSMPAENITAHFFRASQMKRDAEFSCPTFFTAQMNHKYSDPNTANYLFALNHTIFATPYAAANQSHLGVSHMSDIPYVFNLATLQPFTKVASAEDIKLSSEMSGSWAAFATFGNPSHGKGTISGWSDMADSASTSEAEYNLQVIGGPGNGIWTIGNSQGSYEDLTTRCAFWSSEEVMTEMQV